MNKNINIITDYCGKKVVLINDIRFKSRKNINWKLIENALKEYIGSCYEILETGERVYIGSDFPDEFSNSEDRIKTKGANLRAKSNIATVIGELIEIASNKKTYPDYENRHGKKAKNGWYRYDIRFGLPIYDENGKLTRYNFFSARMLVRCNQDGKLYLYDITRIKRETCSPPR